MAKLKISLSFKETLQDKELHDWIKDHSNYSGFIKDILRKEMEKEKTQIFKQVK